MTVPRSQAASQPHHTMKQSGSECRGVQGISGPPTSCKPPHLPSFLPELCSLDTPPFLASTSPLLPGPLLALGSFLAPASCTPLPSSISAARAPAPHVLARMTGRQDAGRCGAARGQQGGTSGSFRTMRPLRGVRIGIPPGCGAAPPPPSLAAGGAWWYSTVCGHCCSSTATVAPRRRSRAASLACGRALRPITSPCLCH